MNPRLMLMLIPLLFGFFACDRRYLTPQDTLYTTRTGPYYQVAGDGLTLALEPLSWPTHARNLEGGRLLPVWVIIANGSPRPVSVARRHFTLSDQWNTPLSPWSPAQFFIWWRGQGFSFFYQGPFPFFWPFAEIEDKTIENRYRSWDESAALTSGRTLLPEMVLQPGDSASGALLFNPAVSEKMSYTLTWRPEGFRRELSIRFTVSAV
ncbi:MAG: hypothetical protein HY751_11875 [Nitrospinae bacterium]|nr:hypothetical protein [Nitrospinota bacterium]